MITQETSFSKYIPTGSSLHSFEDLDDVLAALDTIGSNAEADTRAAHDSAHEFFAAERVIGSMLTRAGLEYVSVLCAPSSVYGGVGSGDGS